MIVIRVETKKDREAVTSLNLAAFETRAEADLVDALRVQALPIVSLVAEIDGDVVGHILFSPVTLEEHPELLIMGLAPMAVDAGYQRMGIGGALVREGLAQCREVGACAVVVLGHPTYYPRFGFKPSSKFGIGCEYDVPEDVFMMQEMQSGSLNGKSGIVRYHAAFKDV
jgi:putative acetyltransferase